MRSLLGLIDQLMHHMHFTAYYIQTVFSIAVQG
jgi:hypothetical protein